MKSFFHANQATKQIREFLELINNIPSSLYDIYDAHILICGNKQINPLFSRLYEVQDDLCAALEASPNDIKLVDYYICSHALSGLFKNIIKRIRLFIDNNRGKLFCSKPEELSDIEYVEFLEYSLLNNYEGFYRSDEDKEYIVSVLKRFRYRPQAYDLIKRLFPASEVEIIENDYMFNFYRYKKDFYKYYYRYYTKNNDYDTKISEMLLLYSEDDEKDCEDYTPYKISFNVDMYKPIEHILEELEDFKNAIYIMLTDTLGSDEAKATTTSTFGFHYLKDYFRQSGKIEERKNVSELFNRWERYLEIYDMVEIKGYQLNKVKDIINSKYFPNVTGKVESTISNECSEAVRLIESAAKGTFPY